MILFWTLNSITKNSHKGHYWDNWGKFAYGLMLQYTIISVLSFLGMIMIGCLCSEKIYAKVVRDELS